MGSAAGCKGSPKANCDPLPPQGKAVVFFDGLCPFCNAVVDKLLTLDKRRGLLFAPLQGKTAAEVLGQEAYAQPGTVVLWDEKGFHRHSRAIVRILARIGGVSGLWAGPLAAIPVPWRDSVYAWVSRDRYRWFGRAAACRLPDETEKDRFLP
jgi:predicted DCC family thiol-disulfide oxidoreductase YuxK